MDLMEARFAAVAAFVTVFSSVGSGGNAARVFVYSQRETPARSWLPVVCDGVSVADLKRGFFFVVNVSAGRHSLSLLDGVPVSVEIHSGDEAFVRLDWHYDVRRAPIPILAVISAERAANEMRFLSYIDAKRIHSTTVPSSDPRPTVQPQLKTREPQ
jgi:hypothetical protein